jgi:hypothetical protein
MQPRIVQSVFLGVLRGEAEQRPQHWQMANQVHDPSALPQSARGSVPGGREAEAGPWSRLGDQAAAERDSLVNTREELRQIWSHLAEIRAQIETLGLQLAELVRWVRLIRTIGETVPPWLRRLIYQAIRLPKACAAALDRGGRKTAPLPPGAAGSNIAVVGQLPRTVSKHIFALAVSRLRQFPPFQPGDYLELHPGVRAFGAEPHAHALRTGAFESQQLFRPERIVRFLGGPDEKQLSEESAATAACGEILKSPAEIPPIGLYTSSHGNIFRREIAAGLLADLRQARLRVEARDETSARKNRPPLCVFVAPHEFFTLGRGPEWVCDEILSTSFMYTTEQMQTASFGLSLPFVLMARGVIDVCAQTAALFREASVPALYLEPTPRPEAPLIEADLAHPLYRALPDSARRPADPLALLSSRAIEISFFGAESPRRGAFFARNAPFLAGYDTFLYCRRQQWEPTQAGTDDGALTRLAAHVSAHSRVTLNLHQDEFGYFEWHRIVRLGMCSGSVVVSEPCLPHRSFKAGIHYFEEHARHIPNLLEWLLRSRDGRERAEEVRNNAFKAIAQESERNRVPAKLVEFLLAHRG